MSDKCFICRKNTRISKCDTCSLKCHYKCWSMYIKYQLQNGMGNTRCCQCFEPYRCKPRTRLSKRTEKKNIIRHVKHLLNVSEYTWGSENKKVVATEIFEYLYKNMEFVHSHANFREIVRNKLIEFNNDNWGYAGHMYKKMFNEPIPVEQIV